MDCRRGLHPWLALVILVAFFGSSANAVDVSNLLGGGLAAKPITNLANYFVGADKLGGKYATAGLLLGGPILSGRYSGGGKLDFDKSGVLKESIKSKLDSLFDPLLKADPFKFDPLAVPKKTGSFFQSKIGTALTAGGDIVSSKLQLKLDGLAAGLGLKTRAGDLLDSAIRTKEGIVRGAIDDIEALTESDPKTAALKNLLFRALIYHLYMDAGVNARLTMLKHIKERVLKYKKLFGPFALGVDDVVSPVLSNLEEVYSAISDLIGLPTNVFYAQDAAEDDSQQVAYRSVADVIQQLGDQIGRANNYYQGGSSEVTNALQRWLDGLSRTTTVSRVDRAQAWRNDLSNYLDTETVSLEHSLNATLWDRNQLIIDFVEGRYLPDVDSAGVTLYLRDLADLTTGSAETAVTNYLSLSDIIFNSIEGLVRDEVTDPRSYVDAVDALANGGTTAATAVWNAYTRAFERQLDLARSVGAQIPEVPYQVGDLFERLIRVLGYVPSYFTDI